MCTEKKDKIINTIKKVCKDQENGENFFVVLKEIYDHVSKHENEPLDNRAQSIKNIINSKWGSSE